MGGGSAGGAEELHLLGDVGDGVHAIDADGVCISRVIAWLASQVAAGEDAFGALAARGETTEHLRGRLSVGRETAVTRDGGGRGWSGEGLEIGESGEEIGERCGEFDGEDGRFGF